MFDLDAPFHDYMIPIYGIQGRGLSSGLMSGKPRRKEVSHTHILVYRLASIFSITSTAATGIRVPGPKMAATLRSYK